MLIYGIDIDYIDPVDNKRLISARAPIGKK